MWKLAGIFRQLRPRVGSIGLVWLGQASVALLGEEQVILIDPFLSPHPDRLTPPFVAPEELNMVDLVLITHEHWDHLDGPTCAKIAQVASQAQFVCPQPLVDQLVEAGIARDRILGVTPGPGETVAGVGVRAIAALHGLHVSDAYSFGDESGAPRFVGYVVELNGVRVYHAGDTILYERLEETVQALAPHIALLPINGRDWYRERLDIVGNLNEREAAQLATAVGAQILVPLHYDMFAVNRGDVAGLVRFVQERDLPIQLVVPRPGQPVILTPVRMAEW